MSYDVYFCAANDARKQAILDHFVGEEWERQALESWGTFYNSGTWAMSNFISAMRHEIGKVKSNDIGEASFEVTVGDLRKMSKAITAFLATSGAQKYSQYLDIFGDRTEMHIYDPTTPFPKEDKDIWSETDCWLTVQQAYDMRKALMQAGNYMESLWEIINAEGYYPMGDFPQVFERYFSDVPDDELVLIQESY